MISLILSTTALGLLLSDKSKKRISICNQLIGFCDLLSMDLSYTVNPINKIITKIINNDRYKNLDFITQDCVKQKSVISSPLSAAENEEISQFLYSLGKSDIKSQLLLIEAFREYVSHSRCVYREKHKKDSKLFVTFGFFSGVVVSLLLI